MGRLLALGTHEIRHSRIRMALRAATQSLCTVVLKGYRTVIASPGGYVWINPTGNPGMAKGGSGDVLSGVIAGLLAQGEHIPGMLGWTAKATADTATGDPAIQGIFRWIAGQNPTADEIHAMASEYEKKQEPEQKQVIQEKCHAKVKQLFASYGSLHVARAVYLHGLAGDIAASLYGQQSMVATDIIHCMGEAFALSAEEAFSKFAYLQR
jgi:NAD(P)H-hydrate repair Nnr-like enzyme with NAD(P)H-hydrate dehydratase domain